VTKDEILNLIDELRDEVDRMDDPPMTPPGDRVPMQPLVRDPAGVVRFRRNALVCYLLDNGGIDLNRLACLPNIPREDWAQLAQLIGYSVSGYGDLSYALGVDEAEAAAGKVP
jgi:hypothetical protein